MLKSAFRILAVALIACAVPIQGLAAVTAGQCMTLGHHQDHGSDGHDHGSDSHADDGDSAASHCGPCAACCASASIAGPAALSLLCSPSSAKYGFAQQPPPGIPPDGLDRPPLAR
jgi:hypothetical protein